ncbi:hypothetical protein [Fimbriiglobus ruber]|uniref:Uncharacterized protein n=1 Tax=Fimbriiglobus ruber TaxID=1908690 RepID=A0A225D959_9BACT|nr:hypothetical protein [Fimbriiglobus ruber]OWK36184.1 hypothetical protein FRUB_08747 [Fimbriiglobus ruber]
MSAQLLSDRVDTLAFPDYDQLRQNGWTVATVAGAYCVAWRGSEETVLQWGGGMWHQVSTRAERAA